MTGVDTSATVLYMSSAVVTAPATNYVECDAATDITPLYPNAPQAGGTIAATCDFAGDVEIDITPSYGTLVAVTWTCPSCHTEHRDDREPHDFD